MSPMEAAIRATPGVVSLFTLAETDATVSVSIGVAASVQAPSTAAAVADAIRALAPGIEVSVRISRVA